MTTAHTLADTRPDPYYMTEVEELRLIEGNLLHEREVLRAALSSLLERVESVANTNDFVHEIPYAREALAMRDLDIPRAALAAATKESA